MSPSLPASPTDVPVIVVGVFARVPDTVILQSMLFAKQFGALLVFLFVDTDRYMVSRNGDGGVVSAPIDPDLGDDKPEGFPTELREHLASVLGGHSLEASGMRWTVRVSAGDPADALSRLAESLDATAIVVGTHRPSVRSTVGEFFNGSVAVHLAHRQHRPVIVIPVEAVASDDALPWKATA